MYLLLAEIYYIMEDLFLLFRNLTFVSFGNSYFCTLAIMRINRENTIGLVIDMQEKLIPTIINHQGIINNTVILLKGLKKFQSPIVVTQQNLVRRFRLSIKLSEISHISKKRNSVVIANLPSFGY